MQYPRSLLCAAGLLASLAIPPAFAVSGPHDRAGACWQRLEQGRAAEARSACGAALRLDGSDARDLLRAGHADWLAGDRDTARARYRQALASSADPAAWRDGPMRELDRLIARGGPRAAAWREARAWLDEGRRSLAQARADLAAARQLAHDDQLDPALALARRAYDTLDPLTQWPSRDRRAALDELLSLQERALRYDELLAFTRSQAARLDAAGERDAELQGRILAGLATALHGLGRYTEAAEAWQRSIENAERAEATGSADLVWLLNARAEALLEAGDVGDARTVLTQATGLLGPQSTIGTAAETFGLLARCLQAQGLPDDALLAARNALQLARHVAREEPAASLRAMAELADVHAAQQSFAEAISLNRQALALAEAELGPEHPVTTRRMERLALAFAGGGQPVGAVMWLQRSLELAQRTLGPQHPEAQVRRELLAGLREAVQQSWGDLASDGRPG